MTFDYWDTLCREVPPGGVDLLRARSMRAVLDERGVEVTEERLRAACNRARAEYNRAWVANVQYRTVDAARACVDALVEFAPSGSALARALFDAYCAPSEPVTLPLVDGVAEVVAALHDAGVALGIVCDVGITPSTVLRENLARHDLLRYFTHWSFSDEVGVYKPHPAIFEHALAGLGGVPPHEAWHVGDRRRTDIAGAQALGMRAARVTMVFDDADPAQGPSGDAVVASYPDLLAVLGLAWPGPASIR